MELMEHPVVNEAPTRSRVAVLARSSDPGRISERGAALRILVAFVTGLTAKGDM
jgi:hypothetical protein